MFVQWTTEFVTVWNKSPFKLWLLVEAGLCLTGLFRSVLKMQRLDVATGRHQNMLFRFWIIILPPKCFRVFRLLTKMHLSIVHLLHNSTLVTGCYDNKQFDIRFFEDTRQSNFNILSFQVFLLVKMERVKLTMFDCPDIWYKILHPFLQLTTSVSAACLNHLDFNEHWKTNPKPPTKNTLDIP